MPASAPPPSSPNRSIFDTLKGIGILEVVIHHSLSRGARKYSDLHGVEWWVLRTLNRLLHFAVPLFLLVSAVLLTQSLLKRPDWVRFVKRRVGRTLWPYFLWSIAYWAFRLAFLKVGSDVVVVSIDLPLIGTVTGPHLLADVPGLFRELVWGKAYFHLYFMVVLLQLAAILPFVILAMRGRKISFGGLVALTAVVQVGAFILQSEVLKVATPASMIAWYVPSVLVGVWIGQDRNRWLEHWERLKRSLVAFSALATAVYLPAALWLEAGHPVSSLFFNSAFSLYSISVSLVLLGFAPRIAESRFGEGIRIFGRVSLPIFLIHPAILYFLSGPKITGAFQILPLPVVWLTIVVLLVSYAIARISIRLRLDNYLFGQRYASVAATT